jgi:hypothetical protein
MVEAGGVELFHGSLVSVIYRFHQGNEVPKVHIAGVIVRVSHRVQRRKRHRLPSSGESHLYRTQLEQNRLLSRHWDDRSKKTTIIYLHTGEPGGVMHFALWPLA